jgi:hypothetical protein
VSDCLKERIVFTVHIRKILHYGMLSVQQKIEIVNFFHNSVSFTDSRRKFQKEYGKVKNFPDIKTIKNWHRKLMNIGSIHPYKPGPNTHENRPTRSKDNMEHVKEMFVENPKTSIRKASAQLNISKSTIHRMLHDLNLFPYKPHILQELNDEDLGARQVFARLMLHKFHLDPTLLNLIIFSDEANFYLNGHVNKQNSRWWSTFNPYFVINEPLHSEKTIVWCGIWDCGIIGPFFFDETINAERYVTMLQNQFLPEVSTLPRYNRILFQQDGAPPHYAKITRNFLDEHFNNRWIGRCGPIRWPPRSPDITPCDFFLWGYLKSQVYQEPVHSIDDLKDRISNACASISHEMISKTLTEFRKRLTILEKNGGDHIEQFL